VETGRLRRPAGELPDLAAGSAVEVDRQDGPPAVDGAAGVAGHQAGGSGVVEDADVHPKPATIPGEDAGRVGDAEADLLDAGDHPPPGAAAEAVHAAGNTAPPPSSSRASAKAFRVRAMPSSVCDALGTSRQRTTPMGTTGYITAEMKTPFSSRILLTIFIAASTPSSGR